MQVDIICDVLLHFWTFAFAVIALGISADLRANGWDEARVNYAMSASVIATALLIVTTFMSILRDRVPAGGQWAVFCLDTLSMCLLVAGGAVIGNWNSRCGSSYAANWQAWGLGEDWESDCGRWHAMESFLWISFAFSIFTMASDIYKTVNENGSSRGKTDPTLSKV